jgi:hypothetical protein
MRIARDLRHLRGLTIERRQMDVQECQQQYGKTYFEQVDVGLDRG